MRVMIFTTMRMSMLALWAVLLAIHTCGFTLFSPNTRPNIFSRGKQMMSPELAAWDRQVVRGDLRLCRAATAPSSTSYEAETASPPHPSSASPEATEGEKKEDVETFQFQAAVSKVMNIIINSLYSNRDVFLRELISNAADACDKKRFLSITNESNKDVDYRIRVRADKEAKALVIEDSGVGMTKDELINNLGSIAHSGTAKFMEALGSGKADINLIGQFGVGFYSGFLVADRLTVVTRSAQGQNPPQWRWESTDGSSYTIAKDEGEPLEGGSGTKLILHLKDDAEEYLEDFKIKELCNKYSEFISFPIEVWTEQTKYEQVPDENTAEKKDDDDDPDSKDQEPKTKTVSKTEWGWEHMNKMKPIWMRNPKEVEDSEYKEFYKSTFKAWDDMLAKSHFSLEGQVEFRALLYIPSVLPYGMARNMFDETERNVRLYVKRVFINDKFEELLPRWLMFIRGIVDSEDLPLNVGREILQKSRILNIISKRLVRKSIDMIKDLKEANDPKNWDTFWGQFGKYLKVGIVEDEKNRDELARLVQFPSSRASSGDGDGSSGGGLKTLKDYVNNMKEGQKSIYFIVADSKIAASASPLLEKAKKLGYEVLFMLDPLDELCAQSLESYEGKKLVDLAKESSSLETPEEDKQKAKKSAEESKEFREWLKDSLGTKVAKVEVSERLVDSPAALVQGTYGMSPTMKRYMSAQGVSSSSGMFGSGLGAAPVLEINIDHPIIKSLSTKQHLLHQSLSSDEEDDMLKDEVNLLYNVAALAGGFDIEGAGSFAKSITRIMMRDLPIDAEQVSSPKQNEETLLSSPNHNSLDDANGNGSTDSDGPVVEAEVV